MHLIIYINLEGRDMTGDVILTNIERLSAGKLV